MSARESLFSLVGKTIAMIDVGDSVTIRFTDGTYLELNGDERSELNGDTRCAVEAWYQGRNVSGRAG